MNKDYRDLFRVFNEYGVRYLVVGAYAVIFYSEPRYTKDLDIWIEPTMDNARRVYDALAAFDAPLETIELEDFCNRELIYQIGVAPNRIDIMMNIPGLRFLSAWKNRASSSYGGERVYFVGLDDLIQAKRTMNREQDRLDLRILKKVRNLNK